MAGTRRDLILGGAAGVVGAAALPAMALARQPAARPPGISVLQPDLRLTVNRERAYRLMKAAGVDAIVGAGQVNSRYLTNMRSIYVDIGRRAFPIIGVMPADPREPIVAIVPAGFDVTSHSQPGRELPALATYTAPQSPDQYAGRATLALGEEPQATPGGGRATDPQAALSASERRWSHASESRPTFNAATAELALRRVLRELGLERGRIAVDEAEISRSLVDYGLQPDRLVDGSNLFRKIRMVKSAVEIDRMRVAARLNGEAVRAMFGTIQAGMRYEDVQAAFFAEVVRRGGRPAVLAAGMVTGLRNDVLVKHEPVMVDGVAHFDGYCGDFGRTIVCGAPSNELEKRIKVIRKLVPATFELVRPGVSYSQLRERGDEIVRKMGADFRVGIGPHSVGMQHTDDAFRDGFPFPTSDDPVLEAGMTITLDMPSLQPGWGSTHMETLILVKDGGAEWLDTHDDALHELPA